MQAPSEAPALPASTPYLSSRDYLVISAGVGGALILMVFGIFIARTPRGQIAVSPSHAPQVRTDGQQMQNNGLTKATNDFLNDLSRKQRPVPGMGVNLFPQNTTGARP
jgi:hypothetical protein